MKALLLLVESEGDELPVKSRLDELYDSGELCVSDQKSTSCVGDAPSADSG
jgi:hypothetical protein